MEAALFATARREMMTGAGAGGNAELAEAFATVLERGGEAGLDALLAEIVRKRDGLRAFIGQVGGDGSGFRRCSRSSASRRATAPRRIAGVRLAAAGLPARLFRTPSPRPPRRSTRARVLNNILPHARLAFAESRPGSPAASARQGIPEGRRRPLRSVEGLQEGAARPPARPARALCWRQPTPSSRPSDRLALFRMLEGTRAALTIADWLIGRYEQLKTRARLSRLQRPHHPHRQPAGAAGCRPLGAVQARPGHRPHPARRGAGHQPRPVGSGEAAGRGVFRRHGARDDVHRTVFAVGDEKQSIYSFQGAAPEFLRRQPA